MTDILDIACDEACFTGSDLLAKDQRYFAFASVGVSDAEAAGMIAKARADHSITMPELKASKLLGSSRGRRAVAALMQACKGRYILSVHDKLMALCANLFEFIYEPVFKHSPWLLYQKNMHRFVAMFTYMWLSEHESDARRAITEFQKYMRSLDPADAPFLFNTRRPPLSGAGTEHPFESILRFAYGYRHIIIADNANLRTIVPASIPWTLDLSTTCLWAHLNHWGRTGKLLSVQCDESKPLKVSTDSMTGDENDPGISRARQQGHKQPLGWKLFQPVAFVDSQQHPSIQLADVLAGSAVACFSGRLPKGSDVIVEGVANYGMGQSILPDYDHVNLENREVAVNAVIAYGLAQRAEKGENPYEHLAEHYRQAEISWVKGEYAPMRGAAGPRA